jgi:hypothetical protein
MAQVLFTSDTTPSLADLDANTKALYGVRELWKTPSFGTAADGTAFGAYSGSSYKFELNSNLSALGFNVAPSAWANTKVVFDIGALTGVYSDSSSTGIAYNSYYDGTNWRAKTTGVGGQLEFFGRTITYYTAASASAGAAHTFVAAWAASETGFTHHHPSGTASGTAYATYSYNGSGIGSITQSGTTAVLYNTTSDQRLKSNITAAPEAGTIIDAISVRSFDWEGSDDPHVTHGFVAQELVEVYPQAVKVGDDGPLTEESDIWGVDPSKLVPLLVKEVQSLRARVAALEAP